MEAITLGLTLLVSLICAGLVKFKTKGKQHALEWGLYAVILLLLGYGVFDLLSSPKEAPVATNNSMLDIEEKVDEYQIEGPIKNIVPEISVVAGGKRIVNDNEFVYLNKADRIIIEACCNDPLCLSWSSDREFMEAHGFSVNDNGMALLGYYILPVTAVKKTKDQISADSVEMLNAQDPTRLELELSDWQEGFYVVAINAIGAAHNLKVDGKTYYSTTGWVYYWFHVK